MPKCKLAKISSCVIAVRGIIQREGEIRSNSYITKKSILHRASIQRVALLHTYGRGIWLRIDICPVVPLLICIVYHPVFIFLPIFPAQTNTHTHIFVIIWQSFIYRGYK